MFSVGFGGSGHDWSCSLVRGGRIVAAVDEERLVRSKYGLGADLLQSRALAAVLGEAGITPAGVAFAVACDLVPLPLAAPFRRRLIRIGHHLAHAYTAFFSSPFESAAILVADHSGSPRDPMIMKEGDGGRVETLSYWVGDEIGIKNIGEVTGRHYVTVKNPGDYYQPGETDNSLGHMYRVVSEELGFVHGGGKRGGVTDDGKTMGLAAYGDKRYQAAMKEFAVFGKDGAFRLSAAGAGFRSFVRKCIGSDDDGAIERRAAVAYAAQALLMEILIHAVKHLKSKSGKRYLAYGGGVALNCVANRYIAEKGGFDKVFVPPAAGDNGTALGCALHGQFLAGMAKRPAIYPQLPYLGPHWDETSPAFMDGPGLVEHEPENLYSYVAEQLARGKVVGWYSGRSEFGPRALGNRSILADPRSATIKERINRIIKRRELFRPLAPVVCAEHAARYFDIFPQGEYLFPFMLATTAVKEEWRGQLHAITHTDGTARVQVLERQVNAPLHQLLLEFGRLTGFPILLNTSFNLMAEPLVESPRNAMDTFMDSDLDLLVIGNRVFTKTDQPLITGIRA